MFASHLFIIVLVTMLAYIAMAAPTSTASAPASTSSVALLSSKGSPMTNGNYDTTGLPSNIFPNYSGYTLKDTDNLNDGILYLKDQSSGMKMPN